MALIQVPMMMILTGLNAHGRAGLGQLISSIVSVLLTITALRFFQTGITGVALAVVIPITLFNLFYLPQLVCRKIKLKYSQYLVHGFLRPLFFTLPYIGCIIGFKLFYHKSTYQGILPGTGIGLLLLFVIYWHAVVPERLKLWMKKPFNVIL